MADRHLYLDPYSVLEATVLEVAPLGSVVVQVAEVGAAVDQDGPGMAVSTHWVVSAAAVVVSQGSRSSRIRSELIILSICSTIKPSMLAEVPVDRYALASGVLIAVQLQFCYFLFRSPAKVVCFLTHIQLVLPSPS